MNWRPLHVKFVKRVPGYLKHPKMGIQFRRSVVAEMINKLIGFSDASFADCFITGRSDYQSLCLKIHRQSKIYTEL